MQKLLSLSIRQQMIMLIIVMTIVPIGLILYSIYNQRLQDIREATLLVERLADKISDNENMLLSGTEQLLSTLSHLPAVKNHDVKAANALLAELVRNNPQYSNLLLTDKNGLLWASAVAAHGTISYADRRYFKSAIASGSFSSGEYGISRTINKPVMNFGYPIKNSSGKITDVAVVAFTTDRYAHQLQTQSLPTGTSLLLTDHKGTILFNMTAPGTVGKQDREDLFRRMQEGPDNGSFEAISNIGIRRYFAYQKLRLTGEKVPYMYVRTGMPVETIAGKTRSKLLWNLGVMMSMLLLAVGFSVYISKKGVVDKIIALRDATKKVAQGDLDVSVSGIVSGGELGELGRAFDDMTVALIIDYEARMKNEKDLSRYADIVERMQVGLYVYQLEDSMNDRSLKLITANPASIALLGLPVQEVIGKQIDDIFPGLREADIPKIFADVVRSGVPFEMEEFIYADQNVKKASFSFKAFPLPDNSVGVLFENITMRKSAEEALQQLNEELEERVQERTAALSELNGELEAFNYSVSHDLRAPLVRIKGFADILMEESATKLSADDIHYLERLKAAAQRMDDLIEALLKLSSINRSELYLEPVNISALALEILNCLYDLEPGRQVTFTVADQLTVTADQALMKSLLDNLLSNAWKYTSKKDVAVIEIGMTLQAGRNVYFVRDNGAGFNMDYSEEIFAPFRRLHTEEAFQGIGIGLATVQRIIRRHGGRIWAEGKEGEGAVFYFSL